MGIRIPLQRFEPYFTLAGGYATLGGLSSAVNGLNSGLGVNGADVRIGVGLDYFVEPWFSVGAHLTGEILALSRPGVPLKDLTEAKRIGSIDDAKARLLQASGTSVGSVSTIAAVVGFHF